MSGLIDDGGPAFPYEPYSADARRWSDGGPGMSLRDWFAGQVLTGMLARNDTRAEEWAPGKAYAIADAMLAARKKGATQ